MENEKETVLIVDDEPVSLKMLRVFLVTGGYDVLQATDGLGALAKAEERPNLILLDILMPGMDGFELCRSPKQTQLRSDKLTRLMHTTISFRAIPRERKDSRRNRA